MSCPGVPSHIRPTMPHRDCTTCRRFERGVEGHAPQWVGGKCPERLPTDQCGLGNRQSAGLITQRHDVRFVGPQPVVSRQHRSAAYPLGVSSLCPMSIVEERPIAEYVVRLLRWSMYGSLGVKAAALQVPAGAGEGS